MGLSDLVIPTWAKLAAIALVLALAAGGGWWLRDQSAQATIASLKSQHDQEQAKAVSEALATQSQRFEEERRQTMAQATIDKMELDKLKGARDENDRLRDCLRTGTCGLRIAAKCPSGGSGVVPQASAGTGVGTGGTAELDESAQRAYLALRDGIATATSQLRACQSSLKNLTGQ